MRLAVRIAILLGLLLAGLAIFVDRRATAREAASEATSPPEGQLLTVNGRQVHVVVRGAGPDLVLIHGAGGNTHEFTFEFIDMLTDRYRVIVFDRPGAGYTDRTSDAYDSAWTTSAESPAEQADLLVAAALQLGADRPIVLGHSYGAAVAMAWALFHPDHIAGLVDVSGATMPWPGKLTRFYTVLGSGIGGAFGPPMISAFAGAAQVSATLAGVFAPNAVPDGYATATGPELSLRRASLRANVRQVNTLRPHLVAMAALYPTLDLPVEIVHGDADTTVPIDIHSGPLSALIPGANLTILPGIGHMPHHVAPMAVIAAIDRVADRARLR